jgi:hypothetical protein
MIWWKMSYEGCHATGKRTEGLTMSKLTFPASS